LARLINNNRERKNKKSNKRKVETQTEIGKGIREVVARREMNELEGNEMGRN
jgi:hypothetical protein